MRRFSAHNRENMLLEMTTVEFDLLIIGGGITGCGIALDAVTRGMRTALIEMQDFAAGTSSRSTKLIHGGLRYLKQFELKMVAEVGRERAIVFENGPHVTKPIRMLLPIYKEGTLNRLTTSLALSLYDRLAGVKHAERKRMLTKNETTALEPLLKREGLIGAGDYVEYMTDDSRLTIEVIKEAVVHGAMAVNYAKVTKLLYQEGKVTGVIVLDRLSGKTYRIVAKKIVNAAGPWVDLIREQDRSLEGKKVRLTKGVHIVFDQKKFPLKQAVYFDTEDRRMMFAIPRHGKIYAGTTDTFYDQEPMNPIMNAEERDYIIAALHHIFPSLQLTAADVESSWAGLRPLICEEGKQPSEISRKDEIWESETGLITIAGGKLTGYRKMAEKVVDRIVDSLKEKGVSGFAPCQTKKLPISGGHFGGSGGLEAFIEYKRKAGFSAGLTAAQYEKLVCLYGSNIDKLISIAKKYDPENCYRLPLDVYIELIYAMEEEMTIKPADFFIRRTGTLLFERDWVQKWKKAVSELMGDRMGWTEEEKENAVQEVEASLFDSVLEDK